MDEEEGYVKYTMLEPKPGKWRLWVVDGFCLEPAADKKIPNWFHRKMQNLFFGFRWERK